MTTASESMCGFDMSAGSVRITPDVIEGSLYDGHGDASLCSRAVASIDSESRDSQQV